MNSNNSLPEIKGYHLRAILGQGGMSTVYEGTREGRSFAIKLYKKLNSDSSANSIFNFRKEAATLARINHPGLVKVIEVSESLGQPYLVMELVAGESLSKLLGQGILPQSRLISIAKALTQVLCEIHRCGLVHRDLTPTNILIEPNGVPKIIDFGLAMHFQQNSQSTSSDDSVAGTLLYSSPEQIGMIKYFVDGRSDLYSLGCVLFECATGYLPHSGKTLSELLPKLASGKVPSPRSLNPNISEAFSRIIEKLLQKDPEDRYLNALQLLADLERIETLDDALTKAEAISLGASSSLVSKLEMPLVGREEELKKLHDCWNLTLAGKPQIIVIEGQSGSGKSRLVREIFQKANLEKAILLMSKCTLGSSIPFCSLREALDHFLQEANTLPIEEKTDLYEKVKKSIGEFAPLLKTFSTGFSRLLKDEKDLLNIQSQEIYFEAIATCLDRLSKEFPALLLFIDDIQWLDESSREVLIRLGRKLKDSKTQSRLFLIGASRSEIEHKEFLTEFVSKLDPSLLLQLEPLSSEAIQKLIKTHLGGGEFPSGPFFQRIAHLSQGNPLAIEEFLRVMIDAGCLYPTWGSWAADLTEFEKLNLSADVIQIIVKRISGLEKSTQEVLKVAAVLGSEFSEEILRKILNQNIAQPLYHGVQAHLLVQENQDLFSFVHDRVQEALLSELSAEELKEIHHKAAVAIDSLSEDKKQDKKLLFALAHHYYSGYPDRTPERAYDTNFFAGKLALECYSGREAGDFLNHALEIKNRTNLDRDLIVLQEARAEAALMNNEYSKAATILKEALNLAKLPLQRAKIYSHLQETQMGMLAMQECKETTDQGLAELRTSQASKLSIVFSILGYAIASAILYKTGWFFGSAHGEKKEKYRILSKFYERRVLTAITESDVSVILNTIFKQIYLAHFMGISPELADAYVSYSLLSALFKSSNSLEKYAQLALKTAQQVGNPLLIAKIKADLVISYLVVGNYIKSEELGRKVFESDRQWLTQASLTKLAGATAVNLELRGYTQGAIDFQNPITPDRQTVTPYELPAVTLSGRSLNRTILGEVHGASEDEQLIYDLKIPERIKNDKSNTMFLAGHLVISFAESLEYSETSEKLEHWIAEFYQLKLGPKQAGLSGFMFFIGNMYARMRPCLEEMKVHQKVSPNRLKLFEKASRELGQCGNPITDQHFRVSQGALFWIKGDSKKSLHSLTIAESDALMGDNPWARFEALQCRALLSRHLGNRKASLVDANLALAIAEEHSWKPRAQKLRKSFHLDERPTSSRQSNYFSKGSHSHSQWHSGSGKHSTDSYQLFKFKRHLDALLQLNRASSQIGTLDEQTRVAMDEVIKILNAERGYLFLNSDQDKGLVIRMARNSHQQDVPKESGYSRSVVEKIRSTGKALIFTGDKDQELSVSHSIVSNQLRSIMACPLTKEDKLIGVLYLDSTMARGLFQEEDLEVLKAISGHLTVNLEAARSRQLETEKSLLQKEQELTEIRLKSAHAAGMAEIATGTIHNIGNTLTTVVANFDLLKNKLQTSKLSTFVDGTQVLKQNQANLPDFVSNKPNGVPLLKLFIKLGEILPQERNEMMEKIQTIERGIGNVKEVVKMQQEYAQTGLHKESIHVSAFIDELLVLQVPTLKRHEIKTFKTYGEIPEVLVQKNKLFNVLVNLLLNAKEAMENLSPNQREIHIKTSHDEKFIQVQISDKGCGIAPENLNRIFNHNFTTKPGHHGFGLHICANAMSEMGGSICAESPGLGKGATFTVNIPKDKNS